MSEANLWNASIGSGQMSLLQCENDSSDCLTANEALDTTGFQLQLLLEYC